MLVRKLLHRVALRAVVTAVVAGLAIGGTTAPARADVPITNEPNQRVSAHHPLSITLVEGHECIEERDQVAIGVVALTVKNARKSRRGSLEAHVDFDGPLPTDDYRAVLYRITEDGNSQLTCDAVAREDFSTDGEVQEIDISAKLKRGTYTMQFAVLDSENRSVGITSPIFKAVVRERH